MREQTPPPSPPQHHAGAGLRTVPVCSGFRHRIQPGPRWQGSKRPLGTLTFSQPQPPASQSPVLHPSHRQDSALGSGEFPPRTPPLPRRPTAGSGPSPHLQLPLLEAKVTAWCKNLGESTSAYKFIFVQSLNLKPRTFRVALRTLSWGSRRACCTAKRPQFISRERKQINAHNNYRHSK